MGGCCYGVLDKDQALSQCLPWLSAGPGILVGGLPVVLFTRTWIWLPCFIRGGRKGSIRRVVVLNTVLYR